MKLKQLELHYMIIDQPRMINLCCVSGTDPGSGGGSMVRFGEMYICPLNSRRHSSRADRHPTMAKLVFGMGGEGDKFIGKCLTIDVSTFFRLNVSLGNPAATASSARI